MMNLINDTQVVSFDMTENGHIAAQAGVLVLDVNGCIIDADDHYLHRVACSAREVITQRYADIISHPDAEKYEADSEIAPECYKELIRPHYWKNTAYLMREFAIPIVGSAGAVERIVVLCSPLDAISGVASYAQKTSMLDQAMLHMEYASDGHVLSGNIGFLDALGYARDELIGKNQKLLFSERNWMPGYMQIWNYVCGGGIYSGQVEMLGADGRPVWIEGVYFPVHSPEGGLLRVVQYGSNVTWRVRQEQQERESLQRRALIGEKSGNAVAITDPSGEITYINSSFTRMFGYSSDDIVGKNIRMIFGPGHTEWDNSFRSLGHEDGSFRSEAITYSKHGQRFWVSFLATPANLSNKALRSYVTVLTDITDTKMSEVLQNRALEAMTIGSNLGDALSGLCLEAERILPEVIFCVSRLDEQGRFFPVAHPSLPEACVAFITELDLQRDWPTARAAATGVVAGVSDISSLQCPDKLMTSMVEAGVRSIRSIPIPDKRGRIMGVLSLYCRTPLREEHFQDKLVSVMIRLCALALERDRNDAALMRATSFDGLTGLANRDFLVTSGEMLLAAAKRRGGNAAVLSISINRFKQLNESMGYAGACEMIGAIGRKLFQDWHNKGLVGRIAEDEFAVIIDGCDATCAAEAVATIKARLGETQHIGSITVVPTICMGVSLYPENGTTIDDLLYHSTVALAQAKSAGIGAFRFFDSEQDARLRRILTMESALYDDLEGKGLYVCYQPQVSMRNGGLHGAEALLRWNSAALGSVSPGEFIPLAEKAGLISALSRRVVREVCRQLAAWRSKGFTIPTISINLSAVNFHENDLVDFILHTLGENGLGVGDILLELTEGIFLEQTQQSLDNIDAALKAGLRFSMDDFGTGYSSLGYLRRFPVSEIKLDRSFVIDLEASEMSRRLSNAVAGIGQSLDLVMVAEGVETHEQFMLLRQQGYHVAQGYLFAPGLKAVEFERWMQQYRFPPFTMAAPGREPLALSA